MPLTDLQRARRRSVTVRSAIGVGWVVVLVAVVVLADALVRDRAAARIAGVVEAEVGVEVDVDLVGPLAGLRALRGAVPRLELAAVDVPVGDPPVRLDRLAVVVTDLRVEGDTPVGGAGTFRAEVGQDAVRSGAPPDLAPLLSLDADALRVGVGPISVPLDLAADGDALVVSLPGEVPVLDALLGEGLRVPLDVPDGVLVTGVDVAGGRLVLTGPLDPVVVSR